MIMVSSFTILGMRIVADITGRYTPFRLHEYTTTLASEPLLIPSSDPSRPGESRVLLSIPFDLRLPGWLPPSHTSLMTKIEHGVTAKASLGWVAVPGASTESLESVVSDPTQRRYSTRRSRLDAYFFPNTSLSLRNTATSSSKHTSFTIIRHRLPASITGADRPNERQYTLKPEADPDSPVECIVLCPDWVDVNGPERSLKIALRLRAKRSDLDIAILASNMEADMASAGSGGMVIDGPEESGSRPMMREKVAAVDDTYTHVLELGMEIEEVERFR